MCADMPLLRAAVAKLPKPSLEALLFTVNTSTAYPRGSFSKLSTSVFDILHADFDRQLPIVCQHVAESFKRSEVLTFLRDHCHIDVLPFAPKAAMALRFRDELEWDAKRGEDHLLADASAGGACDVLVPADRDSGRRYRKRLGHKWAKLARQHLRVNTSKAIKIAIAAYTLQESGKLTLQQIRSEVAHNVGMSLEDGHPRAFFDRRMAAHLKTLSRKKPVRNHRIALRKFEVQRMELEDAYSESL